MLGEIPALLDELEPRYPGPYTDLGAESVLIEAHLAIGRPSRDLCDSTGRILCRYSELLIWDILQGYSPGTSQKWADSVSGALEDVGLVEQAPKRYDDRLYAVDVFRRQKAPHYAVGLFHPREGLSLRDFLRIVWNNVWIPEITDDWIAWHGHAFKYKVRLDMILEDDPGRSDYAGPRINIGNLPSMASGGRKSNTEHFTKRVNLNIGASRAVDICTDLARGVYFAQDYEEEWQYAGTDTYEPD